MKTIKLLSFFLFCVLSFCLVACSDDNGTTPTPEPEPEPTPSEWTVITATPTDWDGEKRADISYQLLVYSFSDGDGDGYGDINGLISKLDYINLKSASNLNGNLNCSKELEHYAS